jgi:hypothetical protein
MKRSVEPSASNEKGSDSDVAAGRATRGVLLLLPPLPAPAPRATSSPPTLRTSSSSSPPTLRTSSSPPTLRTSSLSSLLPSSPPSSLPPSSLPSPSPPFPSVAATALR